MKTGILKTNGVHLQPHEFHTVRLLLDNGYDVELVPTAHIKGLQMPDIMLNGVPWEIKVEAKIPSNIIFRMQHTNLRM